VAVLIAGAYNALSGFAALADDDTLAAQVQGVLYGIDLTAWGWIWLIIGLAQLSPACSSSGPTCGDSGWVWPERPSAPA
jgi:hypothetical protein